jgi:cysteine sulfinate desulfinase/cysteine desulfurase-like protein
MRKAAIKRSTQKLVGHAKKLQALGVHREGIMEFVRVLLEEEKTMDEIEEIARNTLLDS